MNGYLKSEKGIKSAQNNFLLSNSNSWLFYIVLAVVAIIYVTTFRSGHYWVGDDLQYIRHAMNLVEGKPYIDPLYINNSIATVSPSAYPPIFPIILSIIYILFGLNFVAMKVVLVGFFISSIILLKKILESHTSNMTIISVALLLGINPEFWQFKDRIMSEFPFIFFALLTLLLMQLNDIKQSYTYALLLGIAMYLSYGIREIALVLPLTLITYELWHYQKITIRSLMAISFFIILAAAHQFLFEVTPVHFEFKHQLDLLIGSEAAAPTTFSYINIDPENIIKQGEKYFWSIYRILQIKHLPFSGHIYLFINVLVLTGFLTALFKKVRVTEIYFSGYLCALLLFAGFDGFRYLVPIFPFYLYYLIIGFQKLISLTPSLVKYVVPIMIITVAFVNFMGHFNKGTNQLKLDIRSTKIDQLHAYVSGHTQKNDILVSINPRVLSFFTQRSASAYPFSLNDPQWFMNYLQAINAHYLITEIDPNTKSLHKKKEIDLLFKLYPDTFSQVFDNGDFQVYLIKKSHMISLR